MRCDFEKEKSLIRAYAIYIATNGDPNAFSSSPEFETKLAEAFNNPDIALRAVADFVGEVITSPTVSTVQDRAKETYERIEDSENLASYYIGGLGFTRMESKFREKMLATSILKLDRKTGRFEYISGNNSLGNDVHSVTQRNILSYKEELINDLRNVKELGLPTVNLELSIANDEYTNIVKQTLNAFENYLGTVDQAELENNGVFDSYVILKNFDKLLEKNASYINVDKSYKNIEGVSKYSLNPKVTHFTGFSKDEGADIMKQVSNVADTILRLIPDIDANGKVLASSVGLSGFNGSMQTLKSALLYSNNLGTDSAEFRKAYSKGAGTLHDSEFGLTRMIDSFINNNKIANPNEGVQSFSAFRQVYLHNKLRSIKTYLLAPETPAYIKNMFTQMFYKTESTAYRVYSTNEDGQFLGNNLVSRMIVTQKKAISDVIKGGLKMISKSGRSFATTLLNNYNISVQQVNGAEIMTIADKNNGHSMGITYQFDASQNIKINQNSVNTEYPELVRDFMLKAYSFLIPDTYDSCITNPDNYKWENDFAPFIVLAVKEAGRKIGSKNYGKSSNSLTDANGKYDLSRYNSTLLGIGQRLGVIYGDSVKNVIKSLSGSTLPLFQLTSLEYNWRTCLDDVDEASSIGPQTEGLLYSNQDLLLAPQIRSEVEFNGKIKGAVHLSSNELNKLSIVDDFFIPFLNRTTEGSEGAIYLQNATFSDKARQFLPGYNLKTVLKGKNVEDLYGRGATLGDIIENSLNGGSSILSELLRTIRRDKYIQVAINILSDYDRVFPELNINFDFEGTNDSIAKGFVEELDKVDNYLKNSNLSINDLRKRFEGHANFIEEIHAYAPKAKGMGKVRINETFLNYLRMASDIKIWNDWQNFYKTKFKNDISSLVLNGFDQSLSKQVNLIKDWNHDKGFDNKPYYNNITKEFSFINKNTGELHPIAETYFFIDSLLSNEFNSLTIGEIWAHPNKNKDVIDKYDNTDHYLEFSEASRLVNQIKRSVIFGSTIHPFGQGVKNEEGYLCGVPEKINIAVIKDLAANVFTPMGNSDTIDSQDGGGWCTALESRLENNSLVDAGVGENKKTILHDINHLYSSPTLLKWAVYSLTNSVRRIGQASQTNVENLIRKMYKVPIESENLDLAEIYNNYISNNDRIWIQDQITLDYKELDSVVKNPDGTWSRQYTDGTFSHSFQIDNLYGIDQLFGGAWTFTKNIDGSYTGSEASVDLLTDTAIKYDLRDKQIAYAVNASACKVGATNLNEDVLWNNNESLSSYEVHTKYAGVMMDADHELEDADVTEMSQMISALIEDGLYTDTVVNIYSEIGEIALNNEKIKRFTTAVDNNDKPKIAELLGKSLVKSFQTGNKDTIGLAQAFIKRFDTEFRKAKLSNETIQAYKIPFSDATIFGAFVADITSRLTKDGIRRKYEGYAGVQNPSYGMIQYYTSGEGTKLYSEFNQECKNTLAPHTTIENDRLNSGDFVSDMPVSYSSWQELARNASTLSDGTHNPYWVPLSSTDDIDFEDTVMVKQLDGSYSEIYVDNFKTYDEIRNLGALNGLEVYKNTAAPKNLRGTDTIFTVQKLTGIGYIPVGTYSYYNLDSVRAAQYIKQGIKPDDKYYAQKQALVAKVLIGLEPNTDPLTYCNKLTQNFLEKLDLGKQRISRENLGEFSQEDVLAEFEYQDCFKDGDINARYIASNYNVRPAEIIVGRYQMDKLGLTNQDHIWQIKDYSFFKNRLLDQYDKPVLNVSTKTEAQSYDRVLYHGNKAFLIKVGEDIIHNDDGLIETNCNEINTVDVDLRWNAEVILSDDENDGTDLVNYKFSNLSDGKNIYTLITVPDWDHFDNLKESPFFDNILRKNTAKKGIDEVEEELKFRKRIERLAKEKYDSYIQAKEYVGARIPTQALQSFMPFTVVAFSDTELNQIYIPKLATYIEGSDYDIDKLFLLTATVLENGNIQAGTAIQKEVGFDVAIKLAKPNGINFIESENGYKIPASLLYELTEDPLQWSEKTKQKFIYIVNTLSKINPDDNLAVGINFTDIVTEDFQNRKNEFLKLLNRHSHTKSYIRDSIDTLKTRVFSGIRNVTLSSQTQLKAQVTVDSCTGELKEAAKNTSGGDAEKRVSPNVASSKYTMQEQNMLGKAVVGIGAVSLKTYFMLSTSNNRKANAIIDSINKGDYENASRILNTMVIVSPIKGKNDEPILTTVANTNLDRVLRAANNIPDTWPDKLAFLNLLNTLKQNTSAISAPEFISGIISLSADNAKDLALPKLNATEDLVDIYTTAAMIGIPFNTIKNIMTSPVFTWITKAGKDNIFDDVTSDYKVKNMIKFALLQKNNIWDSSMYIRLQNNYNAVRERLNLPEINFNRKEFDVLNDESSIDNFIKAFENSNGILSLYADRVTYNEEDVAAFEAAMEFDGDEAGIILEQKNKAYAYKMYRALKLLKDRFMFMNDPINRKNLLIINNLVEYAEEMSCLGRQGAINQGLKTNIKDFYQFYNNIQDLVDSKLNDAKRAKKIDKDLTFDFNKFLMDSDYRKEWIDKFNIPMFGLTKCFNILEALANSPNFFSMSKIVPYAHSLLSSTFAYRETIKLVDSIDTYLTENDYRELSRYINDKIIYHFFTNNDISLNLDQVQELSNSNIETYETADATNRTSLHELKLNNGLNIASFKHIMESLIIPTLKNDAKYKNNAFIQDLCLKSNREEKDVYSLPIDMMHIDSDEGSLDKYSKYLQAFNELSKDSFAGQNVGGLFFLYNLIAYKNSFGQQALTRIFEDLVDSKNSPKIIQDYYNYIGNLDSELTTINFSTDEAKYRLANYSRGTKIESDIIKVDLPEDFTFDLPVTADLSNTHNISFGSAHLYSWVPIGNIDAGEAIDMFVHRLNSKFQGIAKVIDDEEVLQNNLPKERAFIKNSIVYFNKDAFKDTASAFGVAMHELSHLVLAGIKCMDVTDLAQSESKRAYYNLLSKIQNDPEFDEIAARYPDRVGSDLAEEVLCNKIEKLLTNRINENSEIELGIINNNLIVSGLKQVLPDHELELNDLINSNLEFAIEKYASSMFSFVDSFKQDYINASQKLAALKTWLFDAKDKNYNLKQDCK